MFLSVRVVPNSKKVEITKLDEGRYKVRLDAVPAEGKANLRLIEVLAEYFNVPKSSVSIIKGHKRRNKNVRIL